MTSLGRSPLKPKGSSEGSRFPTTGNIAAAIETEQDIAPAEVLTTYVDGSYQIDVDEPSDDKPALSDLPYALAVAAAAIAHESAKVEPAREKKVSEPRPPKIPKPPNTRIRNHDRIWIIAAGVVGAIGLLLSVILATGALFIALDGAQGSGFFSHLSDVCDLLVGPLKDVFTFSGVNADKKQTLVGWGLGSMGYLLVGRFLQSVLTSRVKS